MESLVTAPTGERVIVETITGTREWRDISSFVESGEREISVSEIDPRYPHELGDGNLDASRIHLFMWDRSDSMVLIPSWNAGKECSTWWVASVVTGTKHAEELAQNAMLEERVCAYMEWLQFDWRHSRYCSFPCKGLYDANPWIYPSDYWEDEIIEYTVGVWVYFIRNIETDDIKIGFSHYPTNRLQSLQSAQGASLELLAIQPGGKQLEAHLHHKFSEWRKRGEWFHGSDALREYICGLQSGETQGAVVYKLPFECPSCRNGLGYVYEQDWSVAKWSPTRRRTIPGRRRVVLPCATCGRKPNDLPQYQCGD